MRLTILISYLSVLSSVFAAARTKCQGGFQGACNRGEYEVARQLYYSPKFPQELFVSEQSYKRALESLNVPLIKFYLSLRSDLSETEKSLGFRVAADKGWYLKIRALSKIKGLSPNKETYLTPHEEPLTSAVVKHHWRAAEAILLHPELNLSKSTIYDCFYYSDVKFMLVIYADPRVPSDSLVLDTVGPTGFLIRSCKIGELKANEVDVSRLKNSALNALLRCSAGKGQLRLFGECLEEFISRSSSPKDILYEVDYLIGYSALFSKWDILVDLSKRSTITKGLQNASQLAVWSEELDASGYDNLAKLVRIVERYMIFVNQFQKHSPNGVNDPSMYILSLLLQFWHEIPF